MSLMSEDLLRFAQAARAFQEWVARLPHEDTNQTLPALSHLLNLSLLALPLLPLPELHADVDDPDHVADHEWKSVYQAAAALPLGNYAEVFDPLVVPAETPVVGDIADDLADVYREIITGLRLVESGKHLQAHWHWAFTFQVHWGKHATSAIRALYAVIASNDEHLSLRGA